MTVNFLIANSQSLSTAQKNPANVKGEELASTFEAVFKANNWPPQWRDGVYDYHHFHSKSHETMGVASGHAKLMLGGPSGKEVEVKKGDVLILPAGTGHCSLSSSEDFLVTAAYPPDQQNWDICRGDPSEHDAAVERISHLKVPSADPVGGTDGVLVESWVK